MECLLIADDLTGACDAAVPFAAHGRRATVALASDARVPNPDVLAVSTESRGLSLEESQRAIKEMALRFTQTAPRILFKKIDSTLRGNAGAEIAAAMEAFDCGAAVITPAFPAMRRIVVDGWLRVEGTSAFEPVELAAYLQSQGLASHRHCSAGSLAASLSVRYVSVDAACDADLDAIVRTMKQSKSRILWAGSAGLAAALARSIPPGAGRFVPLPQTHGPALFCIGSTHPATIAQQNRLVAERPVCALSAESAAPGDIAGALRKGCNVILEVPRERIPEKRLADLLQGARGLCSAVALSGGDTASHVGRSLHADSIELHDEIKVGIPWGTLRGGLFDGVAVITKSGAFGDSSALIEMTDFFTCPKT